MYYVICVLLKKDVSYVWIVFPMKLKVAHPGLRGQLAESCRLECVMLDKEACDDWDLIWMQWLWSSIYEDIVLSTPNLGWAESSIYLAVNGLCELWCTRKCWRICLGYVRILWTCIPKYGYLSRYTAIRRWTPACDPWNLTKYSTYCFRWFSILS